MARASDIVERLAGLVRDTSSSLPADVEKALASALRREDRGASAAVVLRTILDNVRLARSALSPLCQDTGSVWVYLEVGEEESVPGNIFSLVDGAVGRAYEKARLRSQGVL